MQPRVHKNHKIKFFQASSSGKNTVPLLHIQEIQDVSKIYQHKKKLLSIQGQKPGKKWIPEEEKQIKIQLSAEQKIEQYKKNQHEKAMHHKRGHLDQKEKIVRPKIHATPLKRFLKRMSNYSLNDSKSSYLHQIKESQKQLHFVKCNPTRKRRIPSTASSHFHRKRILSLQNGLPMDLGDAYPTLEQKIDQLKPPLPPPKLNLLQSVERDFGNYFSQYENRNMNGQSINYLLYEKLKQQKLINKARTNINHSVDTVERMITTVSGYYSMKHDHKQEYSDLISTWKVDRPKTNELRCRNYNIQIGSKDKKKNLLDVFRKTSQNIRSNDLEKSKTFYNQLLDFIISKVKNMNTIPVTKMICDQIRQQLQLNFKLDKVFLSTLVFQIEKSKQQDQLVDSIVKKTKEYIQSCY